MAKYINKDILVAELKKRISLFKKEKKTEKWSAAASQMNVISLGARIAMLEEALSFIDTLEVEEINNVWNNASDFPKAEAGRSILLVEDNGRAELLKSPSAEKLFYFRPENIKMWAYVDELLPITTHFDAKE